MNIYIATNNGEIGGGEVMLFNIAKSLKELGYEVKIIAPRFPSDVINKSANLGFDTMILPAKTRRQYMLQLMLWSITRRKGEMLWCNGLVPAFSTSFQNNRIVHLHQVPLGNKKVLFRISKYRSWITLVPSNHTSSMIAEPTKIFYNWVEDSLQEHKPQGLNQSYSHKYRIGFLGRPATIKGTHTLAETIKKINGKNPGLLQLVIGGAPNFVNETDQAIVKRSIEALGSDSKSLGWISPRDFFEEIDILVVPSEVPETFGLVVAEAMSAKKPIIVSDMGALPEIVGDDYPFIFKNGDIHSLEDVMMKCIDFIKNNNYYESELASKLRAKWENDFSPEAGKTRVKNLLEEIQ